MEQLLEADYVLTNLPNDVKRRLINLSQRNPGFFDWFVVNIDKIRSKFRGLSNLEEIHDVLTELVCASILLNSSRLVNLAYEPLGTSHPAPDYCASLDTGEEVYIEVRRIRRSTAEVNRDIFLELFRTRIREIQLNFAIALNFHELENEDLDESSKYSTLVARIDDIIEYIRIQLEQLNENFDQDKININLDEFMGGLYVEVYTVRLENRDNRVHSYGNIHDCPMSGRELTKFGDIICEKIPQLVVESPNIIFIFTDNDSHWFEDLEDSVVSINRLIREQNDAFFIKKGFEGADHFLRKSRKLSGVFVMGKSLQGKLWVNGDSDVVLSPNIIELLRECQ